MIRRLLALAALAVVGVLARWAWRLWVNSWEPEPFLWADDSRYGEHWQQRHAEVTGRTLDGRGLDQLGPR